MNRLPQPCEEHVPLLVRLRPESEGRLAEKGYLLLCLLTAFSVCACSLTTAAQAHAESGSVRVAGGFTRGRRGPPAACAATYTLPCSLILCPCTLARRPRWWQSSELAVGRALRGQPAVCAVNHTLPYRPHPSAHMCSGRAGGEAPCLQRAVRGGRGPPAARPACVRALSGARARHARRPGRAQGGRAGCAVAAGAPGSAAFEQSLPCVKHPAVD